jgi:hypothetical protein
MSDRRHRIGNHAIALNLEQSVPLKLKAAQHHLLENLTEKHHSTGRCRHERRALTCQSIGQPDDKNYFVKRAYADVPAVDPLAQNERYECGLCERCGIPLSEAVGQNRGHRSHLISEIRRAAPIRETLWDCIDYSSPSRHSISCEFETTRECVAAPHVPLIVFHGL